MRSTERSEPRRGATAAAYAAGDTPKYFLCFGDDYFFDEVAATNFFDDIEALDNLAKTSVMSVEVCRLAATNDHKKLRTARVWASVCHRKYASVVVLSFAFGFASDFVAWAAVADTVRATALNDKTGNDAVKAEAVVEAFFGQRNEVCYGAGCLFLEEFGLHKAFCGMYFCYFHAAKLHRVCQKNSQTEKYLCGIITGFRAIQFRRGAQVNSLDFANIIFLGISGIVMLGMAIWHYKLGTMIAIPILFNVFGVGAVADAYRNFRRLRAPHLLNAQAWLAAHVSSMLGAFIASTTAFTVNAATFLPWYIQWFGPTILLLPLQIYWGRKLKPARKAETVGNG